MCINVYKTNVYKTKVFTDQIWEVWLCLKASSCNSNFSMHLSADPSNVLRKAYKQMYWNIKMGLLPFHRSATPLNWNFINKNFFLTVYWLSSQIIKFP